MLGYVIHDRYLYQLYCHFVNMLVRVKYLFMIREKYCH